MKVGTRYLIIGAVVLLIVAIAAAVWPRWSQQREVDSLLTRYNKALAIAVSTLDPEKLGDVVASREKARVSTYITHLWGEDIALRSEFVSLEILDIRSEDPTVTVLTEELWRNSEGVRSTGVVTKPPTDQVQRLRYTLLRGEDGRLRVYRSDLVKDEGTAE